MPARSYVDGVLGYWAPAVAFVVAEGIFVTIVAAIHALFLALLPKPSAVPASR